MQVYPERFAPSKGSSTRQTHQDRRLRPDFFDVRLVVVFRADRFAVFFFVDFFDAFFGGTFLPSLRASERPIAIACLRLVTFLPDLPLFKVPALRLRRARPTFADALREYFRAMMLSPPNETPIPVHRDGSLLMQDHVERIGPIQRTGSGQVPALLG
ncbi:MAG: hypothetical protein J0H38_06905 [Rhizobiales bacterium]|nr:hypothetical protein [Hyphomicrobiales bacterium]